MTKKISNTWKNALSGAKYMVEQCGYDYDSGSMDEFLRAVGCDTNDNEFMNWYFKNIVKELGLNEDE